MGDLGFHASAGCCASWKFATREGATPELLTELRTEFGNLVTTGTLKQNALKTIVGRDGFWGSLKLFNGSASQLFAFIAANGNIGSTYPLGSSRFGQGAVKAISDHKQ